MTKMNKSIALGVLAFNEEAHILDVLTELKLFKLKIYVINDASTDNTNLEINKFNYDNLEVITNSKNKGAGVSTKILLNKAKDDGYDFLVKIDGDGQFSASDIEKIINIYTKKKYKFIKSNRFWESGIDGSIPIIRYLGNLIATLFLQISTGTNKIYDPLNGLFGISLEITKYLNDKSYPKRYGYPYFLTISAIINNFKTYQINNVVKYRDETSNLNSIKMLFTILKLSILFYFKKLIIKLKVGRYQKSAFYDILFIIFLLISILLVFTLIFISFYAENSIISTVNMLILTLFFSFCTVLFFSISFREEMKIRNEYIDIDK